MSDKWGHVIYSPWTIESVIKFLLGYASANLLAMAVKVL